MKKYNLFKQVLTVLFAVLIVQGCTDKDLDAPFAKQTAVSFFSEGGTDSYNKAIIGGYAKLTQFYKNYTGVNGTPRTYLNAIALMRDDMLTSNQPDPYEVFGSLTATDASTSDYYKLAYQLVNRVNLTLEYMAEYGDKVFVDDMELKNTYEGEARFMRAYMYFHMAINYDTPPLIVNTITDLAFVPSNSASGEVLDYAISELTAAAALLPDSWAAPNTGRVTKGSALGILGKALLHKATVNGYNGGDLGLALAAFNQIDGLGYSLLSNFGDNFDGEKENGAESLFELQFGNADSGNNNIWVPIDDFNVIGDLGGTWGFYSKHWSIGGARYMLPSAKLEASFEAGDPRMAMTVAGGIISKYTAKDVVDGAGKTSFNNARVLRLADVMLMKAEAMLMSGGDKSVAIGMLNKVRERARNSASPASAVPADRNTAETDENVILQWIMEERVAELSGEEAWRWYDLIRWHKAGKIDMTSWDFSSIQTTAFDVSKHLLLPFPASEVSVSSGSLVQNAGY